MYIHGEFINEVGDTIAVYIVTGADKTSEIEIGSDGSGIYFSSDPVKIESQINDTFDNLLQYNATISFICDRIIPDFFQASPRSAVVNIYRNSTCIFAGFIKPQAYSQPFSEILDDLDIECIDALSVLSYSKYKDIGTLGISYSSVKSTAAQITFLDIFKLCLNNITSDIDILGNNAVSYWYDGSKAVSTYAENQYTIFSDLSISELLFLGDSEDDVWTQDTVISEILKYLNLHIVQEGFNFMIFSWSSVKNDKSIVWQELGSSRTRTTVKDTVTISLAISADTDANVSINDVYNQIELKCDVKSIENVIESPLDSDDTVSPYSNKQLYLTTHDLRDTSTYGKEKLFYAARNTLTTAENYIRKDYYIQVMNNPLWSFSEDGDASINLISKYCDNNSNQHILPNLSATKPIAMILSVGSINTNTDEKDNSVISKISAENQLVLSVNGNEVDNDETKTYPGASDIKSHIPYARYTGKISGGVFSPSDADTINYIVFSGKICLNPIVKNSVNIINAYNYESDKGDTDSDLSQRALDFAYKYYIDGQVKYNDGSYYLDKVKYKDGNRLFLKNFYTAATPHSDAVFEKTILDGFTPYSDDNEQLYKYSYSAIGDGTDTISKVAFISCMLIIGNKCVVETGTSGKPEDMTWQTYKELSECTDEDEYYQQSFTLGVDPKMGDYMIGTEFDLQNNISFKLGIDAEGTAIPIRKSDKVSGAVRFMILGPVNVTWDVISRRHPTFFRHTKWSSTSVPLLAHVSNIIIKNFEVKVYSDNGLINNTGSNDLIYLSDTNEKFVNKKSEEVKINSALTTAECISLGVTNSVKMSNPLNVSTQTGLETIYDANAAVSDKPEKLFVDSYYNEYHKARIQLVQSLVDKSNTVGLFEHYNHPAIGKNFFVVGITRNLMSASAEMNLKEIES